MQFVPRHLLSHFWLFVLVYNPLSARSKCCLSTNFVGVFASGHMTGGSHNIAADEHEVAITPLVADASFPYSCI